MADEAAHELAFADDDKRGRTDEGQRRHRRQLGGDERMMDEMLGEVRERERERDKEKFRSVESCLNLGWVVNQGKMLPRTPPRNYGFWGVGDVFRLMTIPTEANDEEGT